MPRYTLFHAPACPYCHFVRQAADELGIELDLVDVTRDAEARRRLWQERGRGTVPVLEREDGSLMGESRDIVRFFHDQTVSA
jgi:glutaredoxin 2